MKREAAFFAAGALLGAAACVLLRPAPVAAPAPVLQVPRPELSEKVGRQAVPGGWIYRVPGEGLCFVPEPEVKR